MSIMYSSIIKLCLRFKLFCVPSYTLVETSYSTCSVGRCHLKDEINEVNQRKDHLGQKIHLLSDKRFDKADHSISRGCSVCNA